MDQDYKNKLKFVVFRGSGAKLELLVSDHSFLPSQELSSIDKLNDVLNKISKKPHFINLKSRIFENFIHLPVLLYLGKRKGNNLFKNSEFISLNKLKKLSDDDGAILCEALSYFWDLFKNQSKGFDSKHGFKSSSFKKNDEIIIYGGSFNPWHKGHDSCLRLCPDKNKIIVVPDFNPFKDGQNPDCFFEFYKDLCQKVDKYGVHVFPLFCGISHKNPTSSWAPNLKNPFSLLMGDDSFISLPKWNKPILFLNKVKTIYLVARNEERLKVQDTITWLKEVSPKINLVFLGRHPYQSLSSTEIRSRKKN